MASKASQQEALVKQGVGWMLDSILKDLQVILELTLPLSLVLGFATLQETPGQKQACSRQQSYCCCCLLQVCLLGLAYDASQPACNLHLNDAVINRFMQAPDPKKQMRALNALKDLTRSHRATHGVSAEAVQVAYREAGGFPLLLRLIDGCMTPRGADSAQPDLAIPAAAVDALSTLARNNASNRSAQKSGPPPGLSTHWLATLAGEGQLDIKQIPCRLTTSPAAGRRNPPNTSGMTACNSIRPSNLLVLSAASGRFICDTPSLHAVKFRLHGVWWKHCQEKHPWLQPHMHASNGMGIGEV